ncbi:DEAD/DEAH box helicase family protein [Bifidobacterium sp. 82T24]|uniref:type III restriction-modification system endonuclease n=1 Tax=Bifidobacterium pluvialisilvae TaxID=2834436 RepID=UPI001C57E004|nr:DEAD/DEAH box helicase family protein [Bifidobacterium pluvialisilvae]MBW3088079.1 DEAD/DEAH box helicase family protein [Bifidobacterium pluvialisilvae]
MRFQFSRYQYQTDAANAVCDVFEGQRRHEGFSYIRDVGVRLPRVFESVDSYRQDVLDAPFAMEPKPARPDSDADSDDTGYRNADIELNAAQLLNNIHGIQRRRNLVESPKLCHGHGGVELDVEMETGTGKTFVYTKTMFELNRRYGWSKFIIVVPSIAIREGVSKSLDTTADYFYTSGMDGAQGYGKRLDWFVYDSSNLTQLDHFASSPDIAVMVINMQAFNTSMKEGGRSKEARIIFTERDEFGSRRPIDVIAATRPIIILDEPQKMTGKATQNGLDRFKPLFTVNYSATHKVHHDLVYSLDALDAYNQRLVKRIEVKGFELNNMRGTDGYLYLQDIIVGRNHAPKARIEYKKRTKTGVSIRVGTFDAGDDLYVASDGLEAYRDGWRIAPDGIVPDGLDANETGYIRFMNGTVLRKGAILNDGSERDLRRIQIRETILSHLQKEEHLWERGIKCLSLFFIDEVAKYRRYDDDGNAVPGEYARIFEEEYDRCVQWFLDGRLDDGHGYMDFLRRTWGRNVHQGYFSIDKHHRMIDSKIKRGHDESDDISAYDLILKNKERLLSFEEPTRFIFSHSALREGWDNPNVFQICTLKHSDSEVGKRQEVGRGLRLCVNKDGVRQDVHALGESQVQEVNLLTVIASESYESFAESLQKDITADLRKRPLTVDNAFFARISIPADRLGPEHAGEGNIDFSEEQARQIYRVLMKRDLIDADDRLTDEYRKDRLSDETVAALPEELRSKADAIRYALDSVCEGATTLIVGNALKTKITSNPINDNWDKKEFQALWKRINHKYAYTVSFDDDELIGKSITAIDKNLVVARLSYTVTRGIQDENASREKLAAGEHFAGKRTRRVDVDADATDGVSYDLLGEIARRAAITRRCAAAILKYIHREKFLMFRDNPEQFISKVSRIIVEQKAAMIVDHICYDRVEGEYDSDIFTMGGAGHDESDAYRAEKCVQDWVFPDGFAHNSVERRFAENLDASDEVAVYAKLPRGFRIPTPVGEYAPDWAVAFRESSGLRHLFFVAETKGDMGTLELRGVEQSKIECAKKLFNEFQLAGDVRYDVVDSYGALLEKIQSLR